MSIKRNAIFASGLVLAALLAAAINSSLPALMSQPGTLASTIYRAPGIQASEQVTVNIMDNFFSPSRLFVKPGTEITWAHSGVETHSVTADPCPNMEFNSDSVFPSGLNTGNQFRFTVPANTPLGTTVFYHCRFHGAPGHCRSVGVTMFGSIVVTDTIPDFNLTVAPSSQSVARGASTSLTINLQAIGGFNKLVTLDTRISPENGIQALVSPAAITPNNTATLTITTTAETPPATYMVTIIANELEDRIIRTATAAVTVTAGPDFTLSVSPSSQTVAAGSATSFKVDSKATGNLSGPISLNATVNPTSSGITASFSPQAITPNSSSTLTVNTAVATPPNAYVVTVTGSAGQLARTAATRVEVTPPSAPDFELAFEQASFAVGRGDKRQLSLNIKRVGGFAGNVTITPPDTKALKIKLTPPTQSTTGTSVNFTLKIKNGAPTGTQQLVFTGKDDSGRTRTATLTLTIQ